MTVCPQCGYERINNDDNFVSNEECPKCGIFYKKWNPSTVSKSNEPTITNIVASDVNKEKKTMLQMVILIAASFLCLWCFVMLLGWWMFLPNIICPSNYLNIEQMKYFYLVNFMVLVITGLIGLKLGILEIRKKEKKNRLILWICFLPIVLIILFFKILANLGP